MGNRGALRGAPREYPSFRGLTINGPLRSIFIGDNQSGQASGADNVVIGDSAGTLLRSSAQCIIIGSQAGGAWGDLEQGAVAIGYQAALKDTNSGNPGGSVAIGYQAAQSDNTIGVAVGYQAASGSGGNANGVAIGHQAGQGGNAAGVCIGFRAGQMNGAGGTVYIGYQAGVQATPSGVSNVFIGYSAGQGIGNSSNNVLIGFRVAYAPAGNTSNLTSTGAGQTCLGYQTGQASSTQVNYITCLGYQSTAGAAGAVAIGTDHTGTGATTSTQDEIKLGTANHTVSLSALHFNASANESTGSGSAALGSNCPAVTPTAPTTWEKVTTSAGSTGYIPVWV